jgi:hypothetical protein
LSAFAYALRRSAALQKDARPAATRERPRKTPSGKPVQTATRPYTWFMGTVAIKPLNSYADLAAYFAVCQETVERRTRAGLFGAVLKVRGTVRISAAAVHAFQASHAHDYTPHQTAARADLRRRETLDPGARGAGASGLGPMAAARARRNA